MTGISQRANLRMDTTIGIIFASGFAIGIILMSRVSNYTPICSVYCSVTCSECLGTKWPSSAASRLGFCCWYSLFTKSCSTRPMTPPCQPPPNTVRFIQYLLPVLVGVTTVVSLKAVGIILVLALLVTPPATGTLLARRLPGIMAYSLGTAVVATVIGLYLSFHADLPSGPSIVVVATGLFLLALLFSPSKGVVWRRPRLVLSSPGEPPL